MTADSPEVFSIADIAGMYDFVVFDTCNFCAKGIPSELQSSYLDELESVLCAHGNLVTVPDVAIELERFLSDSWRYAREESIVGRVFSCCVPSSDEYAALASTLVQSAEEAGIVDYSKKCPHTDVRLAGLALWLSKYGSTAFTSADRELTRFVLAERNPWRLWQHSCSRKVTYVTVATRPAHRMTALMRAL